MLKKQTSTLTLFLFALTFTFSGCNSDSGSSQNVSLESNIDSVSYSLGYQNGNFLAQQGMDDVNPDLMLQGLRAGLNEEESQLSRQEMQQIIQTYQMQAQQKAQQQQSEEAEQNLKEGQEFLAKNKEKEGVQVTDSGLQYEVLEEGSGPSPAETDTVRVHYEGTLIDGTVFDSSYERDEPAEFPLNRVIEGWTEGLQLMSEGAKYKFYVPSDLAYGENPRPGGPIGPNEVLIFEVELLEVK